MSLLIELLLSPHDINRNEDATLNSVRNLCAFSKNINEPAITAPRKAYLRSPGMCLAYLLPSSQK
jgi:hypothetical protein